MAFILQYISGFVVGIGNALFFLGEIIGCIIRRQIRWSEVFKQVYEQGLQSVFIIALTALASGAVLAMQSYITLNRFGAKEYVAQLVALSLVRELGPVFTTLIFSGKAGARITADLGSMSVNEQILATKSLGVDPIEFLVVPRFLGCLIAVPVLVIFSEIIGVFGGYIIGVSEAGLSSSFYIHQTLKVIGYVDFFSGLIKTVFFALLVGWITCYQGYHTSGGSLGVGRYTTKAVAFSYIFVILSNTVLTKVILTFWG